MELNQNKAIMLDDLHYKKAANIWSRYVFIPGDGWTLGQRIQIVQETLFNFFKVNSNLILNSFDIFFVNFLKGELGEVEIARNVTMKIFNEGLIVVANGKLVLDTRDDRRISMQDEILVLTQLKYQDPEKADWYAAQIKWLETIDGGQGNG